MIRLKSHLGIATEWRIIDDQDDASIDLRHQVLMSHTHLVFLFEQ